MTISLNVSGVEAPAPVASRGSLPVLSPAGVNDNAAIARQQLPTAVPAPALIAAYNANTPQQPKPVSRPAAAPPSSALAAQWIAQGETSDEALQIFAPAPPSVKEDDVPQDDYLKQLKIARGDVSLAEKPAAPAATSTPALREVDSQHQLGEQLVALVNALNQGEGAESFSASQLAANLPQLFVPGLRRRTVANSNGVNAYQLAQARNATIKVPAAA